MHLLNILICIYIISFGVYKYIYLFYRINGLSVEMSLKNTKKKKNWFLEKYS